jgi:hypothetical protein
MRPTLSANFENESGDVLDKIIKRGTCFELNRKSFSSFEKM